MEIDKLVPIIEKHRIDNQSFSLPFVVQSSEGKLYIVWFSFEITKEKGEDWVNRIDYVYILDPNEHLKKYAVTLEAPSSFDNNPPAMYSEYLPELAEIITNYSEKRMDNLFYEKGYKPLFASYIIAKEFVKQRLE